MIVSHVKFERAEIEKFSLKDPVQISILFNDGNTKKLKVTVPLLNVEDEAHRAVLAVRKYVKDLNQSEYHGDEFLDGFVNVVIENEDVIEERMKGFLRKILEKKHQLSGARAHSGYLDMINQVKGIKTEF
ncbi:MAG: hypothetical protein ACE5DM_00155 [Candidatus Nanoarchaeia archaeon]